MTKATKLLLFAFLAFASPSLAQVVLTATGTITDDDSEVVENDNFAYRCSGSGVVLCTDFDSGLTEDGGQYYAGANGTRGFSDTSEKFEGAGSLRFDLLSTETSANIAGSWTQQSGGTLLGSGFGEGDTFYASVMVRITPSMLTNTPLSMGGWDEGSWKTVIFHQNNSTCADVELTTINQDFRDHLEMYTDCGSPSLYTSPTSPDEDQSGSPMLQSAWDLSSGSSWVEEFHSSNVQYPATGQAMPTIEWVEFYWKVVIGTLYGDRAGQAKDSTVEFWIKRASENFRRKIVSTRIALEYNSADTDTYNNLTITPYITGLTTMGDDDASIWFDSLIVSTQPIEMPNSNAVPSWVTDATDSTWSDVPGSDAGDITAAGVTNPTALLTAWTGFAFDSENLRIIGAGMGGHGDRSQNDAIVLDVSQASAAWDQYVAPSGSAANTDADNSSGARGDGSRATDHNYNTPQYAMGRVWFPGLAAMSGASGHSSSYVWSWNYDDTANGELGYQNFGAATASCCRSVSDGVSLVESGADYDPVTHRVWHIKQSWAGAPAITSVSAASGDITTYTPSAGNGNFIQSVVINPRKRTMLMIGNDQGGDVDMLRMNLESPGTVAAVTDSGCAAVNSLAKGFGTVFSQQSNGGHGAALIYESGAQDFHIVDFPTASEDGTGTYTCSTADMSGTAPASIANGVWKKIGLITYPDGTEVIFVIDSVTGPVKFLKLPSGGL